MSSIYRQALGPDFERLHPMMQRRLGLNSRQPEAFIGRGVMQRIENAGPVAWPFLLFGTRRHILFPEQGQNVPFTIENYAYLDELGRETVTWLRTFRFARQVRHFDATMVYDSARNIIVDYLGTHQHLAVDCRLSVTQTGGFTLVADKQRFYERAVAFRFPAMLTGQAHVAEEYDEATGEFTIQVHVKNSLLGTLFLYQGRFKGEFMPCQPYQLPLYAKPFRTEARF